MTAGGRSTEHGKPAVAVVDYDAGNLTSVLKGLRTAGADPFVTREAAALREAAGIVIPGVGNFAATAAIAPAMREAILARASDGTPILGICLGMQFLYAGSEEAPELDGLALLPGRCDLIRGAVKVPHVGWNTIAVRRTCGLLGGVADGAHFYFTHSYAAPVESAAATTTHGLDFAAIVEAGGVFGVQFHPEKSGEDGLRVLRNFVALC